MVQMKHTTPCSLITKRCKRRGMEVLIAQLCLILCDPMDCDARLHCSWDSPGKNTGVGSHVLLQGVFLTQGWNPGLLYCRQILHCLSHQARPFGGIQGKQFGRYHFALFHK